MKVRTKVKMVNGELVHKLEREIDSLCARQSSKRMQVLQNGVILKHLKPIEGLPCW